MSGGDSGENAEKAMINDLYISFLEAHPWCATVKDPDSKYLPIHGPAFVRVLRKWGIPLQSVGFGMTSLGKSMLFTNSS